MISCSIPPGSDGGTPVRIGRNELIRTRREMSSHRRNQTHRQIPREIEAGVPENRSQKKQSAPQKPTDPWVFGYGKPPWETAAETLWETEVWCLLYPGMERHRPSCVNPVQGVCRSARWPVRASTGQHREHARPSMTLEFSGELFVLLPPALSYTQYWKRPDVETDDLRSV